MKPCSRGKMCTKAGEPFLGRWGLDPQTQGKEQAVCGWAQQTICYVKQRALTLESQGSKYGKPQRLPGKLCALLEARGNYSF